MVSRPLPSLTDGWSGFFAGLVLALLVGGWLLTGLLILSPGLSTYWIGEPITRLTWTPLGAVANLCEVALVVGCIGLLREREWGARLAMYAAYGIAVAQGWSALSQIRQGTVSVPLLAVAYLLFAAAMQRRLSSRAAALAASKGAVPSSAEPSVPVPDA